jgi:hypothetical protein
MSTNAWDELNREDPENPGGQEGAEGEFPLDPEDRQYDADEVEDANVSRFDERVIDADEADPPAKKKNLKPLLFALAGVGVLMVGGMAYVMMALLSSPGSASGSASGYSQQAAPSEQVTSMAIAEPAAGSVNLFEEPTSATNPGMGTIEAAGIGGAGALGAAPANAPATSAEGMNSSVAMPEQTAREADVGHADPLSAQVNSAAAPAAGSEQGAELQQRLVVMERDIAEIKRKLDELAKAPRSSRAAKPTSPAHRAAQSSANATGNATAVVNSRTSSAVAKKDSIGSGSNDEVISAAVKAAPAGVEGMSLRAVNPPHGPDMQAWVMDGDRIMVVSRGSVIRGARVTSIELDRVVTDRGVIR